MPSKPEKRHNKKIQDSIILILKTYSFVIGQWHLCDIPGIHHCQIISKIFALHLQACRLGETYRGLGQKNLIYVWTSLYDFQPLNCLSYDKLYVPEILLFYTLIVLNLMCKAVIYHLGLRCIITLCEVLPHHSEKCSGSPLMQQQHEAINGYSWQRPNYTCYYTRNLMLCVCSNIVCQMSVYLEDVGMLVALFCWWVGDYFTCPQAQETHKVKSLNVPWMIIQVILWLLSAARLHLPASKPETLAVPLT